MRTITALSAVIFSIDGPAYFTLIQLAIAIFIAVVLFHKQTKED